MKSLAIFASGGGSNALKIMEYFRDSKDVRVAIVISNKPDAGVLEIAKKFEVPSCVIQRSEFYETENIVSLLKAYQTDWIILAGFLWLIPPYLLRAFPNKIVNIHPALLPNYGGKGMYGHHVHEAVKAAGASESGITIHYANEYYDQGDIIFQASCAIAPEDTPTDIARKVLALEHRHYSEVIAGLMCLEAPK